VDKRAAKKRFIGDYREEFGGIQRGCEVMNIPRSSYYYKAKRKSLEELKREADIQDEIETICAEWSWYGYRRVTAELKDRGYHVNRKKVSRIMREKSLQCRLKKQWIKTTDSKHQYWIYRNRLKKLEITRINQVWVADITYIRLLTQFVYLAVIMDLYSRKVIGWAVSENIDARLTCTALEMALEERQPPAGCIHHSDRGVQYVCDAYVMLLKEAKFEISMSAKGNPYDNAAMESFMNTLKREEVYLWNYQTMADVLDRLPLFLKDVYNQKRLHSSLGYRSPVNFEKSLLLNQNNHSSPTALTV
jgi:putative transposase